MLTGVILAGGNNERMGGASKALLTFSDEILVRRQIQIMKRICNELILVTNEPKPFLPILPHSVRIITDYFPGKGPLGGMYSALSLSKHNCLWVVACDMPFISEKAAAEMWNTLIESDSDAVIPWIGGQYQLLHGVFHKRSVDVIARLLEQGVRDELQLLNYVRCNIVMEPYFRERGINLRFVQNFNTPEEYEDVVFIDKLINGNTTEQAF